MLTRTNTGIATFDGPKPVYSVNRKTVEELQDILKTKFGRKDDQEQDRTVPVYTKVSRNRSSERQVITVVVPEHQRLRIDKAYRSKRCLVNIKDLPAKPSSQYLDHFFKGKGFVTFDLRDQSMIVEELVEELVRFVSIIPLVIVVIEEGMFGTGIEASLKDKIPT